ncbi:MAG: hypothetical protein A3I44_06325 [Candidatus Sungbacteria bacterium RIFCSPLOWO2_02_FULL_51_17]|nr:MAG: hypothetical protein A3I44_06325 [Candidatus Sungbacteria bacterium RIFCSPLOWO2_02_FULL_51_17]
MNNTACRNSTIARLFRTIKRYDAKKQNPDDGAIVSRLRRIVRLRLPMEFLSFTCSTTNPEYLFSKTPWLYVNTDIRGNNLEADLPKLERVYRDLGKSYANIKFIVLVGNTDPYYIYSRQFDLYQGQNKSLLWEKFNDRWTCYRRNFEKWLRTNFSFGNVAVVSWYEFERARERRDKIRFEDMFQSVRRRSGFYFSRLDLQRELESIKAQFGPGKYFQQLAMPSESLLKDWVERKFSEYAVQGLWLREDFPDAILIQNEQPSDLRYRMYQPLIRERHGDVLPNVYFFGVDNRGFG